jgi:hypothetical protein
VSHNLIINSGTHIITIWKKKVFGSAIGLLRCTSIPIESDEENSTFAGLAHEIGFSTTHFGQFVSKLCTCCC